MTTDIQCDKPCLGLPPHQPQLVERKPGSQKGRIHIAAGFDTPDADTVDCTLGAELWEGPTMSSAFDRIKLSLQEAIKHAKAERGNTGPKQQLPNTPRTSAT